MRTDEHSLRNQVGIGSEPDCLLGQLAESYRFLAGLNVEKSGSVGGGGGK